MGDYTEVSLVFHSPDAHFLPYTPTSRVTTKALYVNNVRENIIQYICLRACMCHANNRCTSPCMDFKHRFWDSYLGPYTFLQALH